MPEEDITGEFEAWLDGHYRATWVFSKGDMRAAWGAARRKASPGPISPGPGPDTAPLTQEG